MSAVLLIPKIKTLNLVFFFEIHFVSEKFKLICGNFGAQNIREDIVGILFQGYVASESGEGNGTPLQYFCLENPMDGGAW